MNRRDFLKGTAALLAALPAAQALRSIGTVAPTPCGHALLRPHMGPLDLIAIPTQLLEDSAFDIGAYIAHQIAESRMAEEERLWLAGAPAFGGQLAAALHRVGIA